MESITNFLLLLLLLLLLLPKYVYEVRNDSGGTWWPSIFNLMGVGIFFFQLVTLVVIYGQVKVGESPDVSFKPWAALSALPVLTIVIWALTLYFIAPRAAFVNVEGSFLKSNSNDFNSLSKDSLPSLPSDFDDLLLDEAVLPPCLVKVYLTYGIYSVYFFFFLKNI